MRSEGIVSGGIVLGPEGSYVLFEHWRYVTRYD